MLLKIGTEQDVDVQVVAKRRPGKHLACRECGFKIWASEQLTEVLCAACAYKLDASKAVQS